MNGFRVGPNHNGGVFGGPSGDALGVGNMIQHPFVPSDLWQMPMTLDWDWADMTSGFSGVEGMVGINGNGLPHTNGSPRGHPNGGNMNQGPR